MEISASSVPVHPFSSSEDLAEALCKQGTLLDGEALETSAYDRLQDRLDKAERDKEKARNAWCDASDKHVALIRLCQRLELDLIAESTALRRAAEALRLDGRTSGSVA